MKTNKLGQLCQSLTIISDNITTTSRVISQISNNLSLIIRPAGSHAARSSAGAADPNRWNLNRQIGHARVRYPLQELPGTPIRPRVLQQTHVAMDVLVLLSDTALYHLLGGWLPLHRAWPTRPPPKKIRVDDVSLIPHQAARPGRDRKSTRLNSSHITRSRMPSSA